MKLQFPLAFLLDVSYVIYLLEAQFLKQLTKQKYAHHFREKQEGKGSILWTHVAIVIALKA